MVLNEEEHALTQHMNSFESGLQFIVHRDRIINAPIDSKFGFILK